MNKQRKSRNKCRGCGRLNEPRLANCYYCAEPIFQKTYKSFWEKIKSFFLDFGSPK